MTNDRPPPSTDSSSKPRPMLLTAFFGTMAMTGLGQVLVGHIRRGVLWFAFNTLGLAVAAAAVMLRAPMIVLLVGVATSVGAQFGALVDSLFCGWRPRWQWGEWWSRGLIVVAAWIAYSSALYQTVAVWRATVQEAFVIPTNSMMPALIGESVWGTCPQCGQKTPVVPRELFSKGPPQSNFPSDWARGICAHCGVMLGDRAYTEQSIKLRTKDRILVSKRLAPRRWDIIAFRFPEVPSETYAMRLVGLPGERVELRDGDVTIDGRVIPKPELLRYLNHLNFDDRFAPKWGQTGHAVTLDADEYFVLGDFSAHSRDSRFWQRGAPGHQPFAVPKDHVIGVVTEIYWPRERWRVFERADED